MKEFKGYKCDHCGKLYQQKHWCEKHEKACSNNPDNNRACFGCIHLERRNHDEEHEYGVNTYSLFFCPKLDHFVHPPKVEHKGNAFDTGEYNLPMRKECDLKEEPDTMEEFFKSISL